MAYLKALVLVACIAGAAAASSRISEWEIDLPTHADLTGTPLVDPPKRIAGYFKLNRTHDAKMFYFFFQSRNRPWSDPVVLWMTGGPGCSSELAVFYENGPYSINKDMSLNETQYGWDVYHNMIFVDQPINTGFSYSDDSRDRVYDERLVADDMLDFLQAFFEIHPEIADNDFYTTGESYAGHYVPAVAYRVYRAKELGEGRPINLKGMAIGNGLTDPAIQFGAYADYALENKLISQGLHDQIQWFYPLCRWGAEFCDGHNLPFVCSIGIQFCMAFIFDRILMANPNINVYDITKTCDAPLCYDMSLAEKLLNDPEIRKQLGVGDREWVQCAPDVYRDMLGDWLKSYDHALPQMMEDDIRVMIYAGELDLICNWMGNERWVDAMEWAGGEQWGEIAPREWSVEGEVAGTARELGPLSFVKVYKAGHMVPMDQPKNALTMITQFTRGKSLLTDAPLPKLKRAGSSAIKLPDFLKLALGRHQLTSST